MSPGTTHRSRTSTIRDATRPRPLSTTRPLAIRTSAAWSALASNTRPPRSTRSPGSIAAVITTGGPWQGHVLAIRGYAREVSTAGIVIIGDEILSGKFVEENAAFLIGELRALGVDLRRITIVPDDEA